MKLNKSGIIDYIAIMIGTFSVALGVSVFFQPCNLVTGGVTGLAIIIDNLVSQYFGVHVPLSLSNIVFNIPLFIFGYKVRGKEFLAKTLFATVFLSISLFITELIPSVSQDDLFISAVFGAVLVGIGMALVFRSKTTTGGTDLLASIIHTRMRHVSIAKLLFVVDCAILVLGLFVFGPQYTMYAIIAVYIVSKVTDTFLEGMNFAKGAFIISNNSDLVAKKIMEHTERGATALKARGVYTGDGKDVLFIVMSNKELVVMKDIVKHIDPGAFVVVTDVREVLGEGFQIMQ